jgi:polyhydroxybutyrate depolymerase
MFNIRLLSLLILSLLLAGCHQDDSGSNPSAAPLESGLKTIRSGGVDRSYYLDLPADYAESAEPKPLIIAYHGTGGSHEAWLNGTYDLKAAVGDGAILIYPDARPNAAGTKQWDFAADFALFEQFLDELPASLRFDANRVFVTGHSSGGGFAHELGCKYGNRIRAIAPVAGSLTAVQCTGAVAVLQIQGSKDSVVPLNIGELAHKFWVLYNGFTRSVSGPGISQTCIDHSLGASAYPVQWCLHDEGDGPTAHAWPSFASEAIWAFFAGLPEAQPGDMPPPGGGNDRVLAGADTTVSFTLRFPIDIGTPVQAALVLYASGQKQPVSEAPIAFLNLNFPLGGAGAGDERPFTVPVRFDDLDGPEFFPGTYVVDIVVYVEGGGFPIPVSGIDHTVLFEQQFSDRNTPIIVPGVLQLEPVITGF